MEAERRTKDKEDAEPGDRAPADFIDAPQTQPARPPANPRPESIAGISADWLARRDRMHAGGGLDVRPRAPLDCAWGTSLPPAERAACRTSSYAAVDPREAPPHRSGDEARDEGFAREAAAKQRWRDYRNGDGAYPGLRSMLGKN